MKIQILAKSAFKLFGENSKACEYGIAARSVHCTAAVKSNAHGSQALLAIRAHLKKMRSRTTTALVIQSPSYRTCGYIEKENHSDGCHSVGWRFEEDIVFRRNDLVSFLNGIDSETLKAVVNTDNGMVSYNMADGTLVEVPLSERGQSSVEIISTTKLRDDWETQLLQCVVDRG